MQFHMYVQGALNILGKSQFSVSVF
jgi:hypothetical protein